MNQPKNGIIICTKEELNKLYEKDKKIRKSKIENKKAAAQHKK